MQFGGGVLLPVCLLEVGGGEYPKIFAWKSGCGLREVPVFYAVNPVFILSRLPNQIFVS